MNKHTPINTELGILKGRDCIYLDKVKFKDGLNRLVLIGEINGNLCGKKQIGVDISYELSFGGVLALKMVELDSWDQSTESSFSEVLESSWVNELGGKVEQHHRHFIIQTYDEVFEVVCNNYVFSVK